MKAGTESRLIRNTVILLALSAVSRTTIDSAILANPHLSGQTIGSITAPGRGAASRRPGAAGPADTVSILVDNGVQHQMMEGFGASLNSEVYGTVDYLTASQRT